MKILKRIFSIFLVIMLVFVNLGYVSAQEKIDLKSLNSSHQLQIGDDIYTFTVDGDNSSQKWTGEEVTPISVTVTKQTTQGEENVDFAYDVSYTNNIEVGTAQYTVTAKDEDKNFEGSFNGNFKIEKISSKVSANNIKTTSATINVAKVANASRYVLNISGSGNHKYNKSVSLTNSNLKYNLTSLKPNVKYTVKLTVLAKNSDKEYEVSSSSTSFTTSTVTSKITVSNLKTTSATITVAKVAGASRYVLKVTGSGYNKTFYLTSNLKKALSGLKQNTKYTVQLTVQGKNSSGKYYNISKTTSTAFTTLPTVAKVTVSSVKSGNEMVQINWKAVSKAAGYEIYRSTSKNGTYSKVKTVSSSTKSYTNYLLAGNKTYYYKVRAYKKSGNKTVYGPFSTVKSVKTKKSTNKTYKLRVNIKTNVTTVYAKGFNGKYTAVKAITTSCGVNGKSRPILGTHYTIAKYRWKYMHKDCYTQYATRIVGHYLFHSVPYSAQNPATLWTLSYNKLGNPASDGCVRMNVADSKWIYDHCPLKTRTDVVYSSSDPLSKPKTIKITTTNKAKRTWDPTDPSPKNPWKKK